MITDKTMNSKTKKALYLAIAVFGTAQFLSCSDSFLNQPAKGSLSPAQLSSQAGVEEVLIGAYSNLSTGEAGAGPGSWSTTYTNWEYGDVVGQQTFKGSNSGDQSDINPLSSFTATSTNSYLQEQWINVYDGINRANTTIKLLAGLPAGAVAAADVKRINAEAKTLRGIMHMEGIMMWRNIPYIDETIDYSKGNYKVPNTEDALPKIVKDLQVGYSDLSDAAPAIGRVNKWAAGAFLAKAYLYQKDFASALTVLNDILKNGKNANGVAYKLQAKYRDVFDVTTENSAESVFAIQSSVNDGSGAQHANADLVLNYAYLSSLPVGCCGFNQPSYDLMNSYRTNGGLPYLDGSFNSHQLSDEQWLQTPTPTSVAPDAGPLDPRIDWVGGRTGVPYFDWGLYTGPAWVRSLSDGGPYTPKKYTFAKTEIGTYTDGSSWTPGYSAVNQYLIRYADVLLWAAEAEVEVGSLANATALVNQVRARAANPAGFVKISTDSHKTDWQAYLDPTISSVPAGNYVINQYATFPDKATGRAAVHMEEKLEFGLEGHRFFDVVRWGETTAASGVGDNLGAAIAYNGSINNLSHQAEGNFKVGKSEYYPIPQQQIDLNQVNGKSVLQQNPGY
jgi:starch-binding outer membrane protein, SusD/RagB family